MHRCLLQGAGKAAEALLALAAVMAGAGLLEPLARP